MSEPVLIIGELFIDFAIMPSHNQNQIRLGGIAHAARGLSALGLPFAIAGVCPAYLKPLARDYLTEIGCIEFIDLGDVTGAPNIMVIRDTIEVGDQGYQNILFDEKHLELINQKDLLEKYKKWIIFPGSFSLDELSAMLPKDACVHIDIAYDVQSVKNLICLTSKIDTIFISTSSLLFQSLNMDGIEAMVEELKGFCRKRIVVKENRGGTRVFDCEANSIYCIPSLLGETRNSIGVGDVFAAVFVSFCPEGSRSAGLKAARISSAYAQAESFSMFKTYANRSLKLSVEEMSNLGGTLLPWEERCNYHIYLAAPDFSYVDRRAVDDVLQSLSYHNFKVRRPVQENGELPIDCDPMELIETYERDINLLGECALVFAVPMDRDPGTLVEIGWAIRAGIPVVTYDPREECKNTMVIAGSACYSSSLDKCLNSVFSSLSDLREKRDA